MRRGSLVNPSAEPRHRLKPDNTPSRERGRAKPAPRFGIPFAGRCVLHGRTWSSPFLSGTAEALVRLIAIGRMGVDLRLEDESGECLSELPDPDEHFDWIGRLLDERESVLLRFIDPYGDTVFNRLQVPQLLIELRLARRHATDDRIRSLGEAAIEQSKASDKPKVFESIRRHMKTVDPRAIRRHIDGIIRLAEQCERETHTYLKFYGD